MLIAAIISASLLTVMSILHVIAAKYFSVSIVNGKRPVDVTFQPRATIILSIRGCDPSLEKNLVGLLQQDYDNYDIIAVVDHQTDEGWATIHHIKSEFDTEHRLKIRELTSPGNSCSLKCSALVQALDKLPQETEVIVLVDADVVPHREWLLQATSPLADPDVGVVTGNQWFEPHNQAVGSLVRSLWNAGALVPTAVLANPWAGTCALRVADIRKAGLVDIWKQSIVDDGPLRAAIKPLGKHIVFNPELIMVNRENCTVDYVNRYVPRMLTWSRIYETTYITTFLHMVFLVGSLIVCGGLALAGIVAGNLLVTGICLAALVANVLLNLGSYVVVRDSIRRIESRRHEIRHQHYLSPLSPLRLLRLAMLIPVCQIGFGWWTMRSLLARRVNWRQITYEIDGPASIRMVDYRPISIESEVAASRVSI